MPSVKGLDIVEASLGALCFPPEEGTNQVGESAKVSNSNSFQYLTEFMLDVKRAPQVGM